MRCEIMLRVTFVGVALSALPPAAGAQETQCWLERVGGYSQSTRVDSLNYIHYASGGVDYRCADGARILADSAAVFEASNLVQLFGNVHFEDAETELDAVRAFYFGNDRQLNAWQDVTLTDRTNGAVITGEELIFYRASAIREVDRMVVRGGQPHATVFPVAAVSEPEEAGDELEDRALPQDTVSTPDSITSRPSAGDSVPVGEGGPAPVDTVAASPYEIDAERFIIDGRRFFRAGGRVVVVRDSLQAFGDSLDYDQDVGTMSVIGRARVEDERFDLTATSVSVFSPSGAMEEILAREDAELIGDAVVLNAPAIRMFLATGELDRLIAIRTIPPLPGDESDAPDLLGLSPGDLQRLQEMDSVRTAEAPVAPPDSLSQPSAIADEFNLWADSIDVLSPRGVLDLVYAVGRARGEALGNDSLNVAETPEVARRDWMEGDTIVAAFAPREVPRATAAGGTSRSRLETLTSIGDARSLYRLAASDSVVTDPPSPPALHYVRGRQITIHLADGEVHTMEVEGQTVGYHLEPTPRPVVADTTTAAPDAGPVRPDTADVVRKPDQTHPFGRGGQDK